MPRVQARPRRHRIEAPWLALPFRSLTALGQEQESGGTGSEAGGRGRLELEHGRTSPISPQVDHRDTARTERRWRARQEGGLSSPGVNRQSFLS
jgi:hypothetical protein